MTMTTEYVIISKDELDIKKWEIFLNEKDIEELLEYRDVFIKFLTKWQHVYQTKLWQWKLQWNEIKAYIWIEIINDLKKQLEETEKTYKQYKELKEEKEKK